MFLVYKDTNYILHLVSSLSFANMEVEGEVPISVKKMNEEFGNNLEPPTPEEVKILQQLTKSL